MQWTDSTEPSVQRETAQRDAEPLKASDDGAKPLPWVREPDPYIHPSPGRGAVSAPNADSRPQEIASAPSLQCSTEIKNDSSANNSTSQDVSYEPSSGAQSVVSVPYQENETLASEPVQRAIKAEVDARSEASLEKLTSASQNVSAPNAVSSFGAEADDVQSLISKDTLQRDLLADSATSLPAASDNHISDNHVGNGAGFVESVRPKVGTAVPQRPQLSPKLQPEALPVETSDSLTTVAQLLAEDAVPPHPLSVAPAMTVIQPPTAMGVVQPLTEANEAASDGFADKEAAGLFSAPQTNRHQANMAKASDNRLEQQRRDDERDKQLDLRRAHYLPPGVISGVHGPSSPGLMGDTAESKTMMQDALYAKANMKANFEARQGKPVSKISADEMGELAPKLVPRAELKAQSETKEDKANEKDMEVDGHSFELLAREVYHLLQQRLTVERERYGGYYRDRANL